MPKKNKNPSNCNFTWRELLKVLVKHLEHFDEPVCLFDYATGEYVQLPELEICVEGEPGTHLTINTHSTAIGTVLDHVPYELGAYEIEFTTYIVSQGVRIADPGTRVKVEIVEDKGDSVVVHLLDRLLAESKKHTIKKADFRRLKR